MNKFWKKFDSLMDSLPDYIDEHFGGNSVNQVSIGNTNTSTVIQGGKKVVIKSDKKKMTIYVNGKKVYDR